MKRNLLIAIPVILVTLVAALLIAPSFIDANKYKGQIQDQIKTATGYTAVLSGPISLALLPSPHASIADVQVAAPEGSGTTYLGRLKQLDVSLALMPLLSGRVDVQSIKLIEPAIALEVFKDGTQNWMTPELAKMMGKDGGAQAGSKGPAISIKNINIEKGSFSYRDDKNGGAPMTIDNADLSAEADSLRGPFEVSGNFDIAGQTVTMKANTGAMDASQSVALNADGTVKPSGIGFSYAGVVSTSAPFQAQGETSVTVASLKALTGNADLNLGSDDVALKGLLTATPTQVDFKNATFSLGGGQFAGNIGAALSPLKIAGDFTASNALNLDPFLGPGQGSGKTSASGKPGQLLPQTLTLPMAFDAGIKLSAPALIYRGETYNNVTLLLSKQDKIFAADFTAAGIPGKGNADVKAAVKFAARSMSGKAEVYSDPVLALQVKGQTQNITQTAQAVSGMNNLGVLDMWRTASLDANLEMTPNGFTLKDTGLRLGDTNFSVTGSYATAAARPKMVANIAADTLNIDMLQARLNQGKEDKNKGTLADTLRGLSLPFDLDFDFGAQKARFQQHDIAGLRAQGTFRNNAVSLTNLSAQDFAGAAFKAAGGIADLKNLSGINVSLAGQSNDVRGIAKLAGMDPAGFPASLQSASLSATAAGSAQKLDVNADIKALNGNVIAQGAVSDPLGAPEISGLALQVKHPNLAEALQMFSPGSARYVSLEKPLDIYAEVDRTGTAYSLKNLKATIAGSPVTGNLSIDTGDVKVVKGNLNFVDLVIQTSGARADGGPNGAGAKTAGGGRAPGERWSSAPIDTGWMNSWNVDLSVRANSIVYQNWNLQNPALDISVVKGKLDIEKFDAGLFGGQMSLNGSMQAAPDHKGFSAVAMNAKFSSVQIENMVKALAGTQIIKGSGDVSLDAALNTAGASQAALVGALAGQGTVTGRQLVLDGFDLTRFASALSDDTKPGDTLMGLWKGTTGGGSTAFDALNGAFGVQRGIVNISKLDLDGPKALVATTGTLNLPDWTIATAHTITLKETPDAPPFTIKIAGSLDNPAQTFGQGALNDYLQRKLTRKLGEVLQKKLGGKAGGGTGALDQTLQQLGIPGLGGGGAATQAAPEAAAPEAAVPETPLAQTPDRAVQPDAAAPETAPAAGADDATPAASATDDAPQTKEDKKAEKRAKKQEAIQGLLKGLMQ